MKKSLKNAISLLLIFCMLIPFVPMAKAVDIDSDKTVKIGLDYGDNALPAADLENSVGSGFFFGYYDKNREFVPQFKTTEKKITVVKNQVMYLMNGTYYDSTNFPKESSRIGPYHIQSAGVYATAEAASKDLKMYLDCGLPAYLAFIHGNFRIRIDYFSTYEFARDEIDRIADDYALTDLYVVEPTGTCVTVLETGTANILYEFDCDNSKVLGVLPISEDKDAVTWHSKRRYHGGFEFRRNYENDVTVINVLPLQEYVKGCVPYEMPPSWPLEALKAQAVAARTFVSYNTTRHDSLGFDICNTTCCQVYRGINSATANSNAAVDQTYGMFAYYNGSAINACYHSSNGGSTENSGNVWTSTYPYLLAVEDPFEDLDLAQYGIWHYEFTSEQITEVMRSKEYDCGKIVDVYVSKYTEAGNVLELTIVDEFGKTFKFEKASARSILGNSAYGFYTHSQRYSVTTNVTLAINSPEGETTSTTSGFYVLGAGGKIETLSDPYSDIHIMSADGLTTIDSDTIVFSIDGTGWGHNVGMSQHGARGMALQ